MKTHIFDLEESRFFLLLVIPLSIIIMLLSSPHAWSDGTTHFWTVYHLSNQVLGYSGDDEWKARNEDIELFDQLKDDKGFVVAEELFSDFHFFNGDNSTGDMTVRPMHMTYYSILSYLPEVVGLSLGRVLSLSAIVSFLLARLMMLAVYIVLIYRAIVRTPIGKSVIMVLSLMPFTLIISSSFSYDAMVYVVAVSFISCVLAIRYKYSNSIYVETVIFSFLLGAVKGGGYLLLLPLICILLGADKAKITRKKQLVLIICIIAVGVLSAYIFDIIIPSGQELFQFSKDDDGLYTASVLWKSPFLYLWLMIKTYIENTLRTIMIFGGTETGFLNVLLMILGPLYACFEKKKYDLKRLDKSVYIIVIALVMVFTPVMLLNYSEVDGYGIGGLRARYYLPMMPLLMILVVNGKIWDKVRIKMIPTDKEHIRIKRACYAIILFANVFGVIRIMF